MAHRSLPSDLDDLLDDIRSAARKPASDDADGPFPVIDPLGFMSDLAAALMDTLAGPEDDEDTAAQDESADTKADETDGTETSSGPLLAPEQTVIQDGDDLVVKADMPGVTRDSLEVEVQDIWLTVTADRPKVGPNVIVSNALYGPVKMEIPLPSAPADHQVTADYKNGVLSIRVGDAFAVPEKFTISVN